MRTTLAFLPLFFFGSAGIAFSFGFHGYLHNCIQHLAAGDLNTADCANTTYVQAGAIALGGLIGAGFVGAGPLASRLQSFLIHHGVLTAAAGNELTSGVLGPTLTFEKHKDAIKTSLLSQNVLKEILKDAGLKHATVTSAHRTAEEQAKIVFKDLLKGGKQTDYAGPGREVRAVYRTDVKVPDMQVIQDMANEITSLAKRGQLVSHHVVSDAEWARKNVLDIDPKSIKDWKAFENALNRAKAQGLISDWRGPHGGPGMYDRSYHVEIPQNPR